MLLLPECPYLGTMHELCRVVWSKAARHFLAQHPCSLRARHRLDDSGLCLNPLAGRCFGLEWTGDRMLGAAQRYAYEKPWHVVCARPVLIHHEHNERLVAHCA